MSDKTPIDPSVVTTTQTITSFTVTCRELNLFVNAAFFVDTFDIDNNLIKRNMVDLTTEEYLAWNNNDTYIVNLMATKMGFIIA